MLDLKDLSSEFYSKHLGNLKRFVYDDAYVLPLRPLLEDLLPILSKEALVRISTLLGNIIQENLMTKGATCTHTHKPAAPTNTRVRNNKRVSIHV